VTNEDPRAHHPSHPLAHVLPSPVRCVYLRSSAWHYPPLVNQLVYPFLCHSSAYFISSTISFRANHPLEIPLCKSLLPTRTGPSPSTLRCLTLQLISSRTETLLFSFGYSSKHVVSYFRSSQIDKRHLPTGQHPPGISPQVAYGVREPRTTWGGVIAVLARQPGPEPCPICQCSLAS
jgi:hypothetical protein